MAVTFEAAQKALNDMQYATTMEELDALIAIIREYKPDIIDGRGMLFDGIMKLRVDVPFTNKVKTFNAMMMTLKTLEDHDQVLAFPMTEEGVNDRLQHIRELREKINNFIK